LVRKVLIVVVSSSLVWSCATFQPPPPSLYIGELPESLVTELSLDERILTEDAWNNLKQGRVKQAEKIIEKLGRESPFYYVGLGYASFILNRLNEAEGAFKQSLSDYPEMSAAHIGLAQVYQKTGRDKQAFIEFREVLKTDPNNIWMKQSYEDLRVRKTDQALDEAQTFFVQKDIQKSKRAYLEALFYSPQSPEAHLALARIYKGEMNFQNALIHLRAASENDPKNQDILKLYGEALFEAEDYPRSLEIYEQILERSPGDNEIKAQVDRLKNRLGIFELPSQYQAIPAAEAISKEEIAALLAIKFKDIIEEPRTKPPIIIDIATSWASKYILKITSLGILDVYSNHTFQPKKIITRAEMADILYRFINYLKGKNFAFIVQIPPEKIQISDVSPDNYYYQPILRIISYDIMDLSADRSFNPDLPISGQETIRLLNIILALIK